MTLDEIGEDDLVAMIVAGLSTSPEVIVGPGDDCAVLRSPDPAEVFLLKTDCVVEGVHFGPMAKPSAVGWKAMARAVSDIAAMAGRPVAAVVTVVLPGTRSVAYVRALYRGIERAASRFGARVVGGETSSTPRGVDVAMISVSVLGVAPAGRVVLRSGARPGDRVFVTGRLGGSINGRHLRFVPRIAEAQWLAGHAHPSAMMDLSDGLAQDLPRLARASGVGIRLDFSAIPRSRGSTTQGALGDGEDYELLFTVSDATGATGISQWSEAFPAVRLTEIGRVVPAGDRHDDCVKLGGGWDHFVAASDRR